MPERIAEAACSRVIAGPFAISPVPRATWQSITRSSAEAVAMPMSTAKQSMWWGRAIVQTDDS